MSRAVRTDENGEEWVRLSFLTENVPRSRDLLEEAIWWDDLKNMAEAIADHVVTYRHDETGKDWALHAVEQALDALIPRAPRPEPTPLERERRRMTPGRKRKVMERDSYECRSCGARKDLCVDHIVALANGGSSDDDNLQTLCRPCNTAKGVR